MQSIALNAGQDKAGRSGFCRILQFGPLQAKTGKMQNGSLPHESVENSEM